METMTADQLRALVVESIEPNEPVDTIMATLRANNGKRFDRRIVNKLKVILGRDDLRFVQDYGLTYLSWGSLLDCHRLLISYDEKHITIDADWIWEKNPAYCQARIERNNGRRIALDEYDFSKLADSANAYRHLLAALAKAHSDIEEQLRLDSLRPDEYRIRDLIGVKKWFD